MMYFCMNIYQIKKENWMYTGMDLDCHGVMQETCFYPDTNL